MTLFNLISILVTIVALCGYANYKFVRLPDSIGITAIALLLSLGMIIVGALVPTVAQWGERTAREIDFSEALFHGLLGPLLFAGSLHVDFAALRDAKWVVIALATVGVLISTALVGSGFYYAAHAFGLALPFIDCLLFGALISPTDPLAALGLLRKAGVPDSLLTRITGEALFNDGTGVVIFLALFGIARGTGVPDAAGVSLLLAQEVLGGIAYGLAVGWLGFLMLRSMNSYTVETLITLAMATAGYAGAEALHLSAPIATVVMGLVVGNHGRRFAMSEQTRQRLFSFWELTDELLNLLLFGLVGLELMALAGSALTYAGLTLVAIPLVLLARALSVALPLTFLKRIDRFEPHTVKLMTWAGLRGAISVALALSLPAGESREVIVSATYVIALFSILVQATTVEPLARRWAAPARAERSSH
jgi:CPA1 family monovalent cation:H+ antiporter